MTRVELRRIERQQRVQDRVGIGIILSWWTCASVVAGAFLAMGPIL